MTVLPNTVMGNGDIVRINISGPSFPIRIDWESDSNDLVANHVFGVGTESDSTDGSVLIA